MPATTTLYPYAVPHDLQLRAYDPYDPTDEERRLGLVERGGDTERFQKLDLTSDEKWRALRLKLTADLAREEMAEVLPEGSEWTEDTSLIVSVRCASTNLRRAVDLVPTDRYVWDGEVTLRRSEVRSTVELQPMLARRTAIPSSDNNRSGKATLRGAILATGPGLRIYVDETRRPVRGALPIRWEDFSDSADPWRADHKSDLFAFDPGGDEPQLWLNSWYPALKATLHRQSQRDVDAALRHLTNGMLAQTTWIQLFMTAAGRLAAGEEPRMENLEEWEQDVLSNFLPRVFPDAQSDEERRERLVEILRTPDQMGTLMAALGTAAQQVADSPELFEKAIRAVETQEGV